MDNSSRLNVARTKILFAPEVAERLGRTEAQLRWMIQKGTAPLSALIAGRRCWREADVEAFIEDAFAKAAGQ